MKSMKLVVLGIVAALALAACAPQTTNNTSPTSGAPAAAPSPANTTAVPTLGTPAAATLAAQAPTDAAQGQATVTANAATNVATQAAGTATVPSGTSTVTTSGTSAAPSASSTSSSGLYTPTAGVTPSPGAIVTLAAGSPTSNSAGGTPSGTSATPSATGQSRSLTTITVVQNAALGPILADDQGRTLYAFIKDQPNTSSCLGNCAQLWPAAVSASIPKADASVDASKLAIVPRRDGAIQVVYNGHPLYYYSGDALPGDTKGQGVGGNWFTVSPDGTLNQNAGASGTTTVPSGSPTVPAGSPTP